MLHLKFSTVTKGMVMIFFAGVLLMGALTACGQKGDLYLPSEDEKSAKRK